MNAAWFAVLFAAAAFWYSLRNRAQPGAGDVRIDADASPLPELDLYGTQNSQTTATTPAQKRALSQASLKAWVTPIAGRQYQGAFDTATTLYDLPPGLLSRMALAESSYDAGAQSVVGAVGLMQFMPATARGMGFDPSDPMQSIDGAGRYIAQLFRQFGDWRTALAAYNWGPGNVAHYGTDNLPHETRAYVEGIAGDIGL